MENSVVRFVAGSVRDLQPTTGIACVKCYRMLRSRNYRRNYRLSEGQI